MMNKTVMKLIAGVIASIVGIILIFAMGGVNDSGYRTVIQYPTGGMKIKFTPGFYLSWFGKTTEYPDVITYDFDKVESAEKTTVDQLGIPVRYQDGGTGKIYGVARFQLPQDDETMLKLHNAFRNDRGVAYKLIKVVTDESNNLTAGLMSSEEAYAEQRGTFTEWSKSQLQNGKFRTELKVVMAEDESGKKVTKNIPVIKMGQDGQPSHIPGDLADYGITVSGYQITDWDFESKTLDQIAAKREATMAIITAKAQAEQAKQEALTAEEKGKADVMKAKYEKEVEKERAVVEAEQRKEVAVIQAEEKVEVAMQIKLEAEQKKLAANEYKEEQILRGEGDAEYKRLVLEADGALEQKLAAWTQVNEYYADAVSKQKWTPEIQFTGSGKTGENANTATNLIDLLTAKTAKDISLDLSVGKPNQ